MKSRIRDDLMWTALTQAAVLVGNAVIAALIARQAVELFGSYNLARRIAATSLPLLSLGLTLGLTKFLSSVDRGIRRPYLLASVTAAVAVQAMGSVALVLQAGPLSRALLGPGQEALLWAIWLYACGMTWQAIAYSGFRGTLRQRSANLVNVVGYVVVPLGVVLAARLSAAEVSPSALIGWIGLLNIVVGLGQTARLIVTLEGAWIEGLVGRLHQLLGYSAPRVPGSVAQGLMMTLGPLVAQRGGYSIAASYLLAGLAFAQLGAAALQSFSTVLLPRVSSMHSRGDHIGVRKVTESFIQVMVIFVAVFVPFSLGSTTSLLSLWLGDLFLPSVAATRIVILAVPFYVLYSVLTSVTDALILRPVSTYAAILGLSGMLLGFLFADASSSTQLAVVFLVGQIIAGLIVAITVIAVVRPRLWPRQVVLQVFFGGAGGAAVFGAESFLGSGATHLATTAALGIIMVIVLVMLSPAESGVRSQFSALIGIHRV